VTCIVWDGKTLAADKRVSFGTAFSVTTKIHRIGGMLIGCSGGAAKAASCVQWVRDGMDRAKYPEAQKNDPCGLLVILANGAIHYYTETPDPLVIESKSFGIGSGSEYADAAIYLGKTAREAVEVACALDSGCGNGIDTLELLTTTSSVRPAILG
jgi:ATP-dependent protease HslVU (ClpYQ) peptidase subunit